ncbi:MAG: tRNA lysidine(34) synthetase TilS [Bacillota bacterium]
MDLLTEFVDYINKENLIKKSDSLLLGVSGGPDSMTMLDLFAGIQDLYKLHIVVFHLNHKFRKEAEEEACFVERMADKYGFESIIEEVDIPQYIEQSGLSPEEGARKARFDLLTKWSKKLDIKKIAMAHNKNDLVETVLLNLFRGTGLKGLIGISPFSRRADLSIIHPLLFASRSDIESYCDQKDLRPRHDPSNKETVYTRNKIRNIILPLIEDEINPAVKDVIYRMSANIRADESFLSKTAFRVYKNVLIEKNKNSIILSLDKLQKENSVIQRRIIKNAIKDFYGNVKDVYSFHYQMIDDIIYTGQTGKIVQIKENLQVRISYNNVIIENAGLGKNTGYYSKELPIPGAVKFEKIEISTEVIDNNSGWVELASKRNFCICDFSKINQPLIVRNRRPGDSFCPFGMKGSKKIKDFFIDEKIPLKDRKKIPLVVDNSGRIVWVTGYRTDERFKVEKNSCKLLKIGIKITGGD